MRTMEGMVQKTMVAPKMARMVDILDGRVLVLDGLYFLFKKIL